MPTYEYYCEKCKQSFDIFQSMKEPAVKTCPKEVCRRRTWGKGKVRRLLGSGAGLIFKGSGFYITDYRSSGYKEAAKKETTPAGDSKSHETKKAASPEPTTKKSKE